jgi:hypothetical protein
MLLLINNRAPNEEIVAELQANIRAVNERFRLDPDGRFAAFRQAKAEAERTGSHAPIDRFVQRLKRGDFYRYPR